MNLPNAQVWSLCDRSQNALKPWHDAGFTVCSVDIVDSSGPYPHVKASIHDIAELPGAVFVLAWPPVRTLRLAGRDGGLRRVRKLWQKLSRM